MNRIKNQFRRISDDERTGFIPYVMAGYPSLDASQGLIETLAENGADIIEIGLPYSDPLADGATIQKAGEAALANGVTTGQVLRMARRVRQKHDVPLVIMSYYNLIFKYGLDRFVRDAAPIIDGVILPDLPPEEAQAWRRASTGSIGTSFLLAPTSSAARIRRIAKASEGFVYCVSLTGVTGARTKLPADLGRFVARVRQETSKPLAVGFGISTPAQASEVARVADAVIVGSALVDIAGHNGTETQILKRTGDFARRVRKVLAGNGRGT